MLWKSPSEVQYQKNLLSFLIYLIYILFKIRITNLLCRLDMDAPIRSVWFLSDRDANLPNEEHNKNPLEYLEFVYATGSQML